MTVLEYRNLMIAVLKMKVGNIQRENMDYINEYKSRDNSFYIAGLVEAIRTLEVSEFLIEEATK